MDYSAEDVFDLIAGTIDYNQRENKKTNTVSNTGVIRRPAKDDWF